MNRSAYYQAMKALARETRLRHHVRTDSLGLREVRRIYREEGIRIDLWPHRLRKVRAAYLVVDGEPTVMLNAAMKPVEPRLFSLCHELKHHLADGEEASRSPLGIPCQGELAPRGAPAIEIGAEVFAAEFIFPEAEFEAWTRERLPGNCCRPEDVVMLKRACPAKVSYTFLTKRIERLGLAPHGAFEGVRFLKLEEQLWGPPPYRLFRRSAS